MSDLPIKVLAVVGGAAVGAFAVGALVRLTARLTTRQQLPPWLMFVLRLLGAVAVGWLVALWLFGGGGPGVGGSGGTSAGSGSGGDRKQQPPPSTAPPADRAKPPEAAGESLRVEILGDPAIKRLAGGGRFDTDRRYRVEVNGSVRLLSFEGIQDLVRKRMEQEPPLRRIDLVLYGDSPAHDLPVVQDLERWAKDLKAPGGDGHMQVDSERRDQDAPAR